MNVNKININQSEQTYDILSDAYDITYEKTNVGEKLYELESIICRRYIAFNSIPKLRLNQLDVTIKKGDKFILEGTESGRNYYAYYVNDPSSEDYIRIYNGKNVAENDIVAIYVGVTTEGTEHTNVLKIIAESPLMLESLFNESNLKIGFLYAYGKSTIDIKTSERQVIFPKDWVITYRDYKKIIVIVQNSSQKIRQLT